MATGGGVSRYDRGHSRSAGSSGRMAPDLTQYPGPSVVAAVHTLVVARRPVPPGGHRLSARLAERQRLRRRRAGLARPDLAGRTDDRDPAGLAQPGVVRAGRLHEAVRRRDRARLRPDVRELLAVRRVRGLARGRLADADRAVHPATVRLVGDGAPTGAEPPLGGGAAPLRRGAGAGVPAGAGRIAVRAVLRLAGAGSGRHLEPGAVGPVRGALRLPPGGARRAGPDAAPHMRYEYRRMVGSAMQQAFFETFARICRDLGADLAGPVPRRADGPAGGVRQRGRAGVRGAAVRAALLADRGLGGGAGRQGARQRRDVHLRSTASSAWATSGRLGTGAASRWPI